MQPVNKLFYETGFKIFWWLILATEVCKRPVFHDLYLPPFQNNVGAVPGVVTSRSSQ